MRIRDSEVYSAGLYIREEGYAIFYFWDYNWVSLMDAALDFNVASI